MSGVESRAGAVGESSCLPLVWPGFDFPTRRFMWTDFVGCLLGSERFFPWVLRFSALTKNQHLIRFVVIQFDL